jgi:hypothetical protein
MLNVYLIDGVVLRLLGIVASGLLHLVGGPISVPQRNEDLVWY